jgi:hypothetical protein
VRAGLDEGKGPQAFQDAKLGDAVFAVLGINAYPAGAELAQGLIDLALIVGDDAVDQGQIDLLHRAGFELPIEPAVGLGVFGE